MLKLFLYLVRKLAIKKRTLKKIQTWRLMILIKSKKMKLQQQLQRFKLQELKLMQSKIKNEVGLHKYLGHLRSLLVMVLLEKMVVVLFHPNPNQNKMAEATQARVANVRLHQENQVNQILQRKIRVRVKSQIRLTTTVSTTLRMKR